MADGYLLASFLSPLSNRRADEYGADRLRFPLSVLDAVRAAWPALLMVRLTVTDWARGGLDGRRTASSTRGRWPRTARTSSTCGRATRRRPRGRSTGAGT